MISLYFKRDASRRPEALLIVFLFFIVLGSSPLYGDADIRSDVVAIIDEMNRFRFKDADVMVEDLLKSYPGTFYHPFLEAYKYYWRFLLAPYDEASGAKLRRAVEQTLERCSSEEYTESKEARLVEGCSYIFRSALLLENGKPLASLKWLNRGIQAAKQLENDPVFRGDASFILGSYQLYKVIRNTDAALGLLEIAVSEGTYFKTLARLLTGRIYQRGEEDAQKSLPVYRELSIDFPGNPLISFYYAKNLQMIGQYEDSIAAFNRTIDTITFEPPPLEMLCQIHFSLGQVYEHNLRRPIDALREYRAAYETAVRTVEETEWFIPWSLLHLGGVYAKMGERDEALRWLRMVNKKDDRRAWEKAAGIIGDLSP